jgi:hypothetical protein
VSAVDRLTRAARFQQAMGDGALAEAFATVEQQLADELLNSFDAAQRDNLWRSIQCLRKVAGFMSTAVANGKFAQHQIEELKRVAATR